MTHSGPSQGHHAGRPPRSVLITGGGSGVGAATAQTLVSNGWRVAIAGRSAARLDALAATLADHGHVETHALDVTNPDQLDDAVAAFGPDAVVCSAGVLGRGDVWGTLTPQRFSDTLATNLGGTFNACRSAMRAWKAAGTAGDIVNISSLAGLRGLQRFAGFAAYAASKHAVVGMTEALALDARSSNIRVNAVAPGALRTPMIESLPIDRATDPAAIVPTIEFLLDRARSAPLNGSTIEIYCNEH